MREKGTEKDIQERLQYYRRRLGGDSRLCALSEGQYRGLSGAGDDPALRVTASFALAPVLCMYVGWVLGEASRAGKERLYFLARDGYFMYRAAQILCRDGGLPIECRYLYCSRYTLRTAEYHLLGKRCLDLICLDGLKPTFSGLVERAGLGKERVWEVAGLTGWKGDVEKPLCARQLRELKDWLYGCREFLELVWGEAEKKFPLAAGYLEQEGLTQPVDWALVDSGWTGSIQGSFSDILGAMGSPGDVEGYYFGMYGYPEGADRGKYHPWLFSPGEGLWRMARFNNNLFESIFSAPEGMTEGYALRGGRYEPVLGEAGAGCAGRAAACGKYLEGYAEGLGGWLPPGDRGLASRLLGPLMCRPTRGEAEYFGGCGFWDDVSGDGDRPLAPVQPPEGLKDSRLLRRALRRLAAAPGGGEPSAWPEGSAVRSGRRGELWHCQAYRYALCAKRRLRAVGKPRRGARPGR